jgi:ribosomal protein S18 acetylase RimI-like enzyme
MPPAIILARAASRDDSGGAVLTLARAFARDPFTDWLVRRDAGRAAALRACFQLAYAGVAFRFGCVEVTDDLSGVALWLPPGAWRLRPLRDLGLLPALGRVVGARRLLGRLAGLHALHREHPREPHYYLFVLGVDPERQGQGIGAALLRSRLDRCDEERVGAYLEATTDASRRLYERWGFRVRRELRVAGDAPPVWLMWREPRPPQSRSRR